MIGIVLQWPSVLVKVAMLHHVIEVVETIL